jgi:hypothetical protein
VHEWIRNKLRRDVYGTIGHEGVRIGSDEERVVFEMMERASWQKMSPRFWTVKVSDFSIFEYNCTLATWFFGLNLVGFDYASVNKGRLKIM